MKINSITEKNNTNFKGSDRSIFCRILIMVQMAAFMQSLLKTVTLNLQIAMVIRVIIIQFFDGGYGWKAYPAEDSARLQVVCGSPVSDENPHYLRFTANEAGAGFSNQAYSGITLKKGAAYNVSFYARAVSFLGEITAKVVKDGVTYAEGSVHMAEEDKMH